MLENREKMKRNKSIKENTEPDPTEYPGTFDYRPDEAKGERPLAKSGDHHRSSGGYSIIGLIGVISEDNCFINRGNYLYLQS